MASLLFPGAQWYQGIKTAGSYRMEKEKLDREVEQTFPASDPGTEAQPHRRPEPADPSVMKKLKPRSPDWMYEKKP